jgi:hypothetical protein
MTLSERFNPNNVELNKRRFNELHGHILNKNKGKNKSKGAKFTNSELILELSASDGEETAKKSQKLNLDDDDSESIISTK